MTALIVGGVAASSPLAGGGLDTSSSAQVQPVPIAISGTVAGVASLAHDSVKVQIAPDQQTLAALHGTTSVQNSAVPAASVKTSGSSFTVRVDPAAVPAADISSTGIVNFVVYVQDPAGARFGMTGASVRAVVNEDGRYAWVDPDVPTVDIAQAERATQVPAAARATQARATSQAERSVTKYSSVETRVRLEVLRPTAKGVICDAAGCAATSARSAHRIPIEGKSIRPAERALADVESVDAIDSPAISKTSVAAKCPVGGLGDVYGAKRYASATIGTAYPVGGDTAWMQHTLGSSAEYGATFGVAWSSGGAFHQSSTRSVERSVGFTWDGQKYARAFRVGVIYQKVLAMFDRCSGEPYFTTWVPIGYNGGFGENTAGVTRPDWRNCVAIESVGRWQRKVSNGTAYSSDAGVKFASVVGVDLSSKRNYNAESILTYRIGVKGRRVCGSNTDPAHAGKVMERLQP